MSDAPPPPPGSLQALKAAHGPRYRWLLLMSVMVGTMAAIMSSTVVNVAIPDMSQHFGLGQERAQWATSGFMAAMVASMLTTPWMLSRFGFRLTYTLSMWLLLAGGLVGGLAHSYPLVLAARVAEGLAAGVVQPIPAIIILRAFGHEEQGRASGIFGMGVVLAPALGPSLGGVLVDAFGWRSIFFMVVPFCLVSLWLARRYVPVTGPGGVARQAGVSLDGWGLLLASGGTVCLLNGLVQWQAGQPLLAAGLLGAAGTALLAFVAWQRRLLQRHRAGAALQPLMDLSLFRCRPFAMGSLVAFIYGTALFGSTYLLPVYLQMGLVLSPSYVGALLLPAGVVLALTIAAVGRLADRYPTHVLVSLGLLLLAVSFAGVGLLSPNTPLVWLVVLTVVSRIGLGFVLPSLNLGAMRGLPSALIAQGSSAINFLRMLGGAAGVSLCGIVLEWRLAAHGASLAAGGPPAPRLNAFHETFAGLAALCVLALWAAWHLQSRPPAPQRT
ncbi:DHA2 family efflux MFS transporter permease subunit [Aquabacterium sp. A08]|uniref:DHA2 family efflux MFS transporter permease subunit n=1 Tax=Aquabacterium sp. A08 TaxID=2718532 RepID=UPI0014220D79|nr:DHA2 family efflux MFS transporter permease subunit [Aquabacterium sp. A08]NIC40199.1 multidrug efflux MFS transporter [Aquabacterium sp. A08]